MDPERKIGAVSAPAPGSGGLICWDADFVDTLGGSLFIFSLTDWRF